jgi:peptide/nickel transport system substrate-binding protein
MKKIMKGYQEHVLDRRTFLKIAAITAGLPAIQGFPSENLFAAETPAIELEDPSYGELYIKREGYYMNDPQWVKLTLAGLQWPKPGERVPELNILTASDTPAWLDFMRKVSTDAKELGLKYNLRMVSQSRYLSDTVKHIHENIELHEFNPYPERVDASESVTSRAYGLERRNFGEYVNKDYDRMVRQQAVESDRKKRREYINEAQKILAEDYYITQIGWGPSLVEAYNTRDWDGIAQSKGFGISSTGLFWTYLNMRPKTSRKRVVIGQMASIDTTNILGTSSQRYRSIGRMIYDRLAFLDKDLNVIPWALESWQKVDNRTWDVKLRGGMKFHDGKPVTVDDLKFTFDFTMKYERGQLWTANELLEKVEILDRTNRIVRFTFMKPYGQFEEYFLLINIILPKHLFDGIMEKQMKGNDPRKLEIPHPIGSGPFKFGSYKRDSELLLIANKDHFNAPKIDELLFVVVPSIDGILGRLESEEIDFGEDAFLTPSQAKQLGRYKHLSMVKTPDINWYHAVPMISRLPWRDIEFRRAWHHSLDREYLVKVCWEGNGRVPSSNTFFPDTNPWHNPNLPRIPQYNLNLARQILKEAGYSWDGEGRLVYPPPTDKKFIERVTRVCKEGYSWGGLKMQPLR